MLAALLKILKRRSKWIESKVFLKTLLWKACRKVKMSAIKSIKTKLIPKRVFLLSASSHSVRPLKKKQSKWLSLLTTSSSKSSISRSLRTSKSSAIRLTQQYNTITSVTQCMRWRFQFSIRFGKRHYACKTITYRMETSVALQKLARFWITASSIDCYWTTTESMVISWLKSLMAWQS